MSRKRFSVSPERAAAVELDPDLVLAALKKIPASDWRAHREWRDLMPFCAEIYVEHVGRKSGVDKLDEHGFEVTCALYARMAALSKLMETGHIEPGDASHEAMAEAASAARLTRDEDGFKFQAREFFALLDHAEAERQK